MTGDSWKIRNGVCAVHVILTACTDNGASADGHQKRIATLLSSVAFDVVRLYCEPSWLLHHGCHASHTINLLDVLPADATPPRRGITLLLHHLADGRRGARARSPAPQ